MQRQSRSQFRFPFPPCHAGRDASLQGEIAGGSFSFFFFFFSFYFLLVYPPGPVLSFRAICLATWGGMNGLGHE